MNNIKENNKLIAEFMGGILSSVPNLINLPQTLGESKIHCVKGVENLPNGTYSVSRISELKYHSSWDWLMPVVEKIEGIVFDENNSFNVTIGSTIYCVIQDSNGECYDMSYDGKESKLFVVYEAVVEFIKWYNENNKPFDEDQASSVMFGVDNNQ